VSDYQYVDFGGGANSIRSLYDSEYLITYYVAAVTASGSANVTVYIRVNGVIISESGISHFIGTASDWAFNGSVIKHLAYGDIVDLVIIADQDVTLNIAHAYGARLIVHSFNG
jgi:hypothetical protein